MEKSQYQYYELKWFEVLNGYASGIFPMGEDDSSISWYETSPRAILPIELPTSSLHITRSLHQVLKKNVFELRIDTAFTRVVRYCADRESTWINGLIIKAYTELFRRGYAHSVESWQDGKLAGGLYGVAYRGAFFGESMFHLKSDASKTAVVKLYEILKKNRYILLDIQMMTPHFKQLGAVEISKKDYLRILDRALIAERKFEY
ncbi:MAG: leucyl/phenylalanyl-tRNA--protein transferase [Ignavibacteria bacterium]